MTREHRPRLASLHAVTIGGNERPVLAYVLDGAPYALPVTDDMPFAGRLPERHAVTLGYEGIQPSEQRDPRAHLLGNVTLALDLLARSSDPTPQGRRALREAQPSTRHLIVHADGSFDQADDTLGVAYTLDGYPYALTLPAPPGANGALAEREALRVALLHARELTPETVTVRSDHVFHVRRYAENLVHRGRRKSPSLERLDTLVDEWPGHIRFEYTLTHDADAPHRFSMHARALRRLALELPLSRAQLSALRRVHYALRSPVPVRY